MKKGWNEYKLGDLGTIFGGVTSIKPQDYGYGTPFLPYKNVFKNSKVDVDELVLMNVKPQDIQKRSAIYGDIFFTASSETPDEVAMSSVLLDDVPNLTYNGFCKRYRLNDFQILTPEFARYLFRGKAFRESVCQVATGDIRFNISQESLGNISVCLPPLAKQKRISRLLFALDDKIELNRRINDNLEQQAQAIFKSWFVDFEPFGGEMPHNWHEGVLSDICSYGSGRISVSDLITGTYVTTENMSANKGGFVRATNLPTTPQTTKFSFGDTLVSNIRPYFKKIVYCNFAGGCSADVLCFHPHKDNLSLFVYNTLYCDNFFDYMVAGSKGTKMPRGDKQQIMNYPITIPTDAILNDFAEIIGPINNKRLLVGEESHRLTFLRDTLLPKLMSGELSVEEAEGQV